MKKFLLAITIAFVLVGITSCKPKERCWKVETKYQTAAGDTVSYTNYVWSSAAEQAASHVVGNILGAFIGLKQISSPSVVEMQEYKTKSDCEAKEKETNN